eukprot:COSAG01_NODE_20208_length_965_cov_1.692841_2_plen_49_part_01
MAPPVKTHPCLVPLLPQISIGASARWVSNTTAETATVQIAAIAVYVRCA